MDGKRNIYIWDMDETLILLKSLLDETYARAFNGAKDVRKGVEIGKAWETKILQVCDDYFFYEQIEDCNSPFLDALTQHDDGIDLYGYDFNRDGFSISSFDETSKTKLAYRHRFITELYKKGLHSIFNEDTINIWNDLYDVTDTYTDKWLSSASACLEQCLDKNKELVSSSASASATTQDINVLVTSGSLIPSLVKCLLFRLDGFISCENVYSSWEVGKLQCFSWIRERYDSPNTQFCVIGDGWEECEAAEKMKWPFMKIDVPPGGTHRFPGISLRTLNSYISVVYGNDNACSS
ncbi:eyes absent homolog [Impatiens glandulifera]|uniref:eyes absent homolog n=1 Tax=Impatiens glandulifera TaxID=253017 RepID=UPI001FB06353|nr:eyes absent homolog [Impatiens glandulifera]